MEEKQNALLDLITESNHVWCLKDLEKDGSKKKGINAMTIKDVVKELVDNDRVITDKIGQSTYFWCFKSEALNQRRVRAEKLRTEQSELQETLRQLEEEIASLEPGREDSEERQSVEREVAELQKGLDEVEEGIRKYDKMNPEKIAEKRRIATVARDAANRWTDGIFVLQKFCSRNIGLSSGDFFKAFEMDEEMDYVE